MLRRLPLCVMSVRSGVRLVSGVAPLLYFPPSTAASTPSHEDQVRRNTNIALEMIRRFKGEPPAPYTRKYATTIEELERAIEALLGGSSKVRRTIVDEQPMDKLTLIERCVRHALWSYNKDEGKYDFEQIAKWVVYTAEDESKLAQLRRQVEQRTKLAAYRAKHADPHRPGAPMPKTSWSDEYDAVIDRELVNEKRMRYDAASVGSMERDESKVDALLQQYRRPVQDKRLDELVELLERFKPVLAREAILQRLTIKHLEGQLGVWRYMDWCPEVRDRAELEVDVMGWQWWSPQEERRLLPIRLRSVNEVREIMAKTQAQHAAEAAERSPSTSHGTSEDDRERLLKEVLALQARIHQRSDEPSEATSSAHA